MKSIWVIDDDEIYQKIIRKIISRAGTFEKSQYYRKALHALEDLTNNKNTLPDIILLDINMPQMDGWQFLKILKKEHQVIYNRIDIYIVSSSIAYSDKEKAKDFPEICGFITKPVHVSMLQKLGKS